MKESWKEEMRNKLEGHRKAPPSGLWEGISEQMGLAPETAARPSSCLWDGSPCTNPTPPNLP